MKSYRITIAAAVLVVAIIVWVYNQTGWVHYLVLGISLGVSVIGIWETAITRLWLGYRYITGATKNTPPPLTTPKLIAAVFIIMPWLNIAILAVFAIESTIAGYKEKPDFK